MHTQIKLDKHRTRSWWTVRQTPKARPRCQTQQRPPCQSQRRNAPRRQPPPPRWGRRTPPGAARPRRCATARTPPQYLLRPSRKKPASKARSHYRHLTSTLEKWSAPMVARQFTTVRSTGRAVPQEPREPAGAVGRTQEQLRRRLGGCSS
jgi:hypothetical protein